MTDNTEFVDVLVIGAGLAGIGSACQLRRNMPQLSLAILEARAVSGGTWDLFRYPGIRSDSDMYTYSYGFKPWTDKSAIADGDKILNYIRDAADEFEREIDDRFDHDAMFHWKLIANARSDRAILFAAAQRQHGKNQRRNESDSPQSRSKIQAKAPRGRIPPKLARMIPEVGRTG